MVNRDLQRLGMKFGHGLNHHLVFTININLPFVCKYTIPVLGCPGMGLGSKGVSQGIFVGADFCWPSRPGECDR